MWPAALITAGASAFGRLFAAGILPSTVLVTVVWLLLRADAFSSDKAGLGFSNLIPADFSIKDGGLVLLFVLAIVVVTTILQSFHFGVVRLLEGYWGDSRLAVALVRVGVNRHRSRWLRATAVLGTTGAANDVGSSGAQESPRTRRLQDQAADRRAVLRRELRTKRAADVLAAYPPDVDELLPTRLGNIMRSGERRAGERYGWRTVPAWPRLFPGLSDPVAAAYRSASDAVHTAAVFCVTFLSITLVVGAAFYDDPELWWLPPAMLMLAYVSYRGVVASAVTLGVIQQVAFDRHRFDLFEAMHVPLPGTPDEEYHLAQDLSGFFAKGGERPEEARMFLAGVRRYSHAEPQRWQWLKKLVAGKDQ
ncbi:hypothetical protein SAMN05216188_105228 [Lentzea xinjiangensis]|uniref:Uncharacterized protein n=1 Tax=Lentzea xinjiangensis TaxID=402600 RepID=A0A1H9J5F7_9PSEU|nr:hypothetical protein [Lentzea xinjiangensis]SEQ82261.1 hypothetical protein SAMN05216188_105228 [Lentzea xinjiangensis]